MSAGGTSVITRVTKRSEAKPAADRIDTSEYFQQVFQQGGKPEPKVSAQPQLHDDAWCLEVQQT